MRRILWIFVVFFVATQPTAFASGKKIAAKKQILSTITIEGRTKPLVRVRDPNGYFHFGKDPMNPNRVIQVLAEFIG